MEHQQQREPDRPKDDDDSIGNPVGFKVGKVYHRTSSSGDTEYICIAHVDPLRTMKDVRGVIFHADRQVTFFEQIGDGDWVINRCCYSELIQDGVWEPVEDSYEFLGRTIWKLDAALRNEISSNMNIVRESELRGQAARTYLELLERVREAMAKFSY